MKVDKDLFQFLSESITHRDYDFFYKSLSSLILKTYKVNCFFYSKGDDGKSTYKRLIFGDRKLLEKHIENSICLAKKRDQTVFLGTDAPFELDPNLKTLISAIFENILDFKNLSDKSELAYIDDVTKLFNQRKLEKDLELYEQKFLKTNIGFVVFFIDIDHFKSINDTHGHGVGTKLIREFGDVLNIELRDDDLIYRYGGDEFIVLLKNLDNLEYSMIAERLLKRIKAHTFLKGDRDIGLSASIGVASYPEHAKSKETVIELADKMMYQAKGSGRGKVCICI